LSPRIFLAVAGKLGGTMSTESPKKNPEVPKPIETERKLIIAMVPRKLKESPKQPDATPPTTVVA
jgi:hypothetical protein